VFFVVVVAVVVVLLFLLLLFFLPRHMDMDESKMAVHGGFISFFGGLMMLCKELIVDKYCPHISLQRIIVPT